MNRFETMTGKELINAAMELGVKVAASDGKLKESKSKVIERLIKAEEAQKPQAEEAPAAEPKKSSKRAEWITRREELKAEVAALLENQGFTIRLYSAVPNRVVGALNGNARIYVHVLKKNLQVLVKSACLPEGTNFLKYDYMLDAAVDIAYNDNTREELTKLAMSAALYESETRAAKEAATRAKEEAKAARAAARKAKSAE